MQKKEWKNERGKNYKKNGNQKKVQVYVRKPKISS